MNKLKTTVSVLCLAGLVSSFAMADFSDSFKKTETASNGFYVQGNAALDIAEFKGVKDRDTSNIKGLKSNKLPMFGVGVGYKFNDFLRADVNAQYRTKDFKVTNKITKDKISDNEFRSFAMFANGYVDINNSTIFTPYVTAGVGFMNNSFKNIPADKTEKSAKTSKTVLAGNFGLGTRIQLTDKVDADIGYRYICTKKQSTKAKKLLPQYKAHEILAGIAYHF